MARITWHINEESFLIENYTVMTIKELREGLGKLSSRRRTDDSINAKIKRLKAENKILSKKDEDVVTRSLTQRRLQDNEKTRQEFM